MEITKTEVFECQKCGSISKEKMDIEKCIKKHEKEDLQEKGSAEYKKLYKTVNGFMIKNLHSLSPDDVGEQLISVCNLVGINLDISRISGGAITNNYFNSSTTKGEYVTYSIAGYLSRVPTSKLKGKIVPIPNHLRNKFNRSFEMLTDPKEYPAFYDLLATLEGIDSSGGSGGSSFSYSFKLFLDSFPRLKKDWQTLTELRLKKISYLGEKKRLEKEYETFRKPIILIADIKYQEIKSELDDLNDRIDQLRERSVGVSSRMNHRIHELVSKDSLAHTTPDASFEFDPELEKALVEKLGV
jgi:hypothetical protein